MCCGKSDPEVQGVFKQGMLEQIEMKVMHSRQFHIEQISSDKRLLFKNWYLFHDKMCIRH